MAEGAFPLAERHGAAASVQQREAFHHLEACLLPYRPSAVAPAQPVAKLVSQGGRLAAQSWAA